MPDKDFRLIFTRTQFFAVNIKAGSAKEARVIANGKTLDQMLNPDDEPYLVVDDIILVDELSKRGKVMRQEDL